MNKVILRLAIPNIISNITVPLLSMVGMSIVGHLDKPIYISAIAIATMMFNFIYWGFSFLRMGTSGFTSQAFGAGNPTEAGSVLLRSLTVALVGGLSIVLLRHPIFGIFSHLMQAEAELGTYAARYFQVYVWAAPAVLGMYAFNGWFIGMQDARTPMAIAIIANIINISMSLLFVYVFNMGLYGVALGAAIAQMTGFTLSVIAWFFKYKEHRKTTNLKAITNLSAYVPFFKVNADIFFRTLSLILVTTFFTSFSAKMGNDILAANALLMQLFTLFSYIMDGFANAAEALTGRYIGARQFTNLRRMIRSVFLWGLGLVALFTIAYACFTDEILRLLTNKAEIVDIAKQYREWVLLIPVAGFSAFLWDGIFIGATASRQMRDSMFVAAAIFFALYFGLKETLGNNALWLAFIVYLAIRGVIQTILFRLLKFKPSL